MLRRPRLSSILRRIRPNSPLVAAFESCKLKYTRTETARSLRGALTFSASFHNSIAPINFSGLVDNLHWKVNPKMLYTYFRKSNTARTSDLICAKMDSLVGSRLASISEYYFSRTWLGSQNIWASSCWNLRTLVNPESAPDNSFLCNTPKSANRRGNSRHDRGLTSNIKLRTRKILNRASMV